MGVESLSEGRVGGGCSSETSVIKGPSGTSLLLAKGFDGINWLLWDSGTAGTVTYKSFR